MVKVNESRGLLFKEKVARVCTQANVRFQTDRAYGGDKVFRQNWIFGRTICAATWNWSHLFCTRRDLSKTKQIASCLRQERINVAIIVDADPIWHATDYEEKKYRAAKASTRCQSCGALATSAAICPYCRAPRRR